MAKNKKSTDLVSNRKAFFNYEISDKYEAGMVLKGTEIKSLKEHLGSLQDSYVVIKKNEIWLIHSYIAPYKYGNINNHEERRDRKLLMHKNEIEKLKKITHEKGLALVPLAIYMSKGKAKIKIGVGKGKKSYDKREKIKEKDENRKIQKILKSKNY